MIHATFFNSEGRICRQKTLDHEDEAVALIPEGGGVDFDDVDPSFWFYPNGEKQPRPELDVAESYTILANGDDEILLPLPMDTLAASEGRGVVTDDDGGLIYSTTIAGSRELRLIPPWPWRRKVVVINASQV